MRSLFCRVREGNVTHLTEITNNQICITSEHYEQALAIQRELGDSPEERLRQREGEAGSLFYLGSAYESLGQYHQAIEPLQVSINISRELGNRYEEAAPFNTLGIIYNHLGQDQKAIEYHI